MQINGYFETTIFVCGAHLTFNEKIKLKLDKNILPSLTDPLPHSLSALP